MDRTLDIREPIRPVKAIPLPMLGISQNFKSHQITPHRLRSKDESLRVTLFAILSVQPAQPVKPFPARQMKGPMET